MTTRLHSVSLPVADQDRARAFYTDVLGCELVSDAEALPGLRMVEVRPPGSTVSLLLLPPDGEIPVSVRLVTDDAEAALGTLRAAGATLRNDEVLRLEGAPPMFELADPDGNALVFLEEGDGPG